MRFVTAAAAACLAVLSVSASADDGDKYGALMGGLYRPDQARDDIRAFTAHGVWGVSSGDYRAWEFNAFTDSARNIGSTGSDRQTGLGLDLNWGRREPGQFFLLTGAGGVYEQNRGDDSRVNPYLNLGGGLYLPFDWAHDLVRLEARWNGVFGKEAAGRSELLHDFRLQVGIAFGARRAPPEPIRIARAEADQVPDADGDGIADALDRCADTPHWVRPDATGCAPDSDHDGVFEGWDRCPDTSAGATVNRDGCSTEQADSDGDGVRDRADLCPDTASGTPVNAEGCAELGKVQLGDVHFETDRDILTAAGLRVLDDVAATLRSHGDTQVEVDGHADATGPAGYNQQLALRRAQAAREFLIYRGVAAGRITVKSFGESQPKASNDTGKGRAQNRRIEFKVVQQRADADLEPATEDQDIPLIPLGDNAA